MALVSVLRVVPKRPEHCSPAWARRGDRTLPWILTTWPAEALPEPASTDDLTGFIRRDYPDSETPKMPDPTIMSESGPRLTFCERTPVGAGGCCIGEELDVAISMLGGRGDKAKPIGH